MRVKIEEVKSSQSNQNDVDFYKKWRLYAKTLLCTSITDIFRHILLRSVRQAPPPLFWPSRLQYGPHHEVFLILFFGN